MANLNLILPSEVINEGITRPTPLNARFDKQLIAPHITVAEQRWLVPLLGDDLYNDMVADQAAAAEPPTVPKFTNVNYEALWNRFLWSYNARAVQLEAMPTIGIQTGANGLYLNNTNTSENAGIQGIKLMQDWLQAQLMTLQTSIKKYLCDNSDDFPLYDAATNCDSCGNKAKVTRGNFHLIVPKNRKKC